MSTWKSQRKGTHYGTYSGEIFEKYFAERFGITDMYSGGGTSDGERPEMPEGDFPDGKPPEKPEGGWPDGEKPEKPEGG